MKDLYTKFGEIICVDTTYNLNKNKYPCLVITVKDNFARSRIVAIALLAYERETIIQAALSEFKSRNDISITKAIMIDKDLTEAKVLEVNICYFIKQINTKINKYNILESISDS